MLWFPCFSPLKILVQVQFESQTPTRQHANTPPRPLPSPSTTTLFQSRTLHKPFCPMDIHLWAFMFYFALGRLCYKPCWHWCLFFCVTGPSPLSSFYSCLFFFLLACFLPQQVFISLQKILSLKHTEAQAHECLSYLSLFNRTVPLSDLLFFSPSMTPGEIVF